MRGKRINPFASTFAVLAGVAWTAAVVVHASQPEGCVGQACATASMRAVTGPTVALMLTAGLALLFSCTGLLLLITEHVGLTWTGVAGFTAVSSAIADLALAAALQGLVLDEDSILMPVLVVPGVAALGLGLALTSWTALRARVLPRWVGVVAMASTVLLLLMNEQTDRVLFAVPFGLAWVLLGISLVVPDQTLARRRAVVPSARS